LLACFRDQDIKNSPLLDFVEHETNQARHLHLQALEPRDAHRLAASLLPDSVHDDTVIAVGRESRGNPFFISQMAAHLTTSIAIPCSNEISLNTVILGRVEKVSATARHLLELIVVASKPISVEAIVHAAGLLDFSAEAMESLLDAGLIKVFVVDEVESVESYHDRIRETVLRGLDDGTRVQRHRELATSLEKSSSIDAEALALHLDLAGEPERASVYALTAAKEAAAVLAFDKAAQLFRFVVDRCAPDDDRYRPTLVMLAEALENVGRSPEAADAYLAASVGTKAEERLELLHKAARELLNSGHTERGLEIAGPVLDELQIPYPRTQLGAVISLFRRRLTLRLRGLESQPSTELSRRDSLRMDICWSMTTGLGLVDNIRNFDFGSRLILLALSSGEPLQIARGLTIEATIMAALNRPGDRRAAEIISRIEQIGSDMKSPYVLALAAITSQFNEHAYGHYDASQKLATKALGLFGYCTSVTWESTMAQGFAVWSLFLLGRIRELIQQTPGLVEDANRRGNVYYANRLRAPFGVTVWLAQGDVSEARQQVENLKSRLSRLNFQAQYYWRPWAETLIELYEDDRDTPWHRIQAQWAQCKRSKLMMLPMIRLHMHILRAMCALAFATVNSDSTSALRTASRSLQKVLGLGISGGNAWIRIYQAAIEHQRGRTPVAEKLLTTAGFELEDKMHLYSAIAHRSRGILIGGDQGHQLIKDADDFMKSEGIVDPARFARMLVPGFD
ncbi:MAG: hypothetical protein HN348_01285, partial [Proteobacteria bacterium]|nr:hypothetical protein [Pseudomonadota bacterium]